MYKVFLDIKYSISRNGHHPVMIGAISEDSNKFYAEFNDFPKVDSNSDKFIKELKFDPPLPREDEHWMVSKPHDYELRGNSEEISKNLYDWMHRLLGGPESWIDYSEEAGGEGYRNIKPVVDDNFIEIWTYNVPIIWRLFTGLWGGITDRFPKFVHPWPMDVFSIVRFYRHVPTSFTCDPIGGANSIKEWYYTFEDRR